MHTQNTLRHAGFVLIEALVALLLIAFGLLGIAALQAMSTSGAGEAKSRSEALTFSEQKLEEVRNMLVKTTFTGSPLISGSESKTGSNATYTITWTVSTPTGGLEQRLVTLRTTWTDSKNIEQTLDLNSVIAWDDPGSQGKLASGLGGSLISPTGSAQRGSGIYDVTKGVVTNNGNGSKTAVDGNKTYLLSSTNNAILLTLPPINGAAQSFTTITGKIFFDQNAGNNAIPSSSNVRVRLSSEGECIYDSTPNNMIDAIGANNSYSYKYFVYTCYVGPGWYGNVGVVVDESANGNAASPAICLGDPSFNGGASDGTLISAHPLESGTRTYRGFKGSAGSYLSTGMGYQSVSTLWSGTKYGKSYDSAGAAYTGPFDGRPSPSQYPGSYASMTAGSALDYFEQNFLITSVSGNSSCNVTMAGGAFTRNAGKYVCINPDSDPSTDQCPDVWPGFESEVGSSSNSTCTTPVSGSAFASKGTVTANPSNGGTCSMGNGNTTNYSCSFSLPQGTTVTLTNSGTVGNGNNASSYSYTQTVTLNCQAITGINFGP